MLVAAWRPTTAAARQAPQPAPPGRRSPRSRRSRPKPAAAEEGAASAAQVSVARSKWSVTVDAAPIAPPLVADGRVVLALRSGVLSAWQVRDGKDAWTVKLAVDQPLAADAEQHVRRHRRDAARA